MTLASKRIIWAQHLIFWVSLSFINLYISLVVYDVWPATQRFISTMAFNVVVYVFCYHTLVNRFYETKKYWQFVTVTLAVIAISTLVRALLERYFYLNMAPDIRLKPERRQTVLVMMYFSQGVIVIVSSLLGIAKNKLLAENRMVELDKRKVETELSLLKAKINPHFLLNTLNNIHYQAREEGGKSSDSIIQLSQLLQFTIYETARKRIPLEREVEIMEGLVELYRLRFKHRPDITLNAVGLVDGVEIAPAVLLILLENALKHSGIGLEEDSFIRVSISLANNQMLAIMENSIAPPDHSNSVYSGLGLTALRNLLDMEYTGQHRLHTQAENNVFRAELEITLN